MVLRRCRILISISSYVFLGCTRMLLMRMPLTSVLRLCVLGFLRIVRTLRIVPPCASCQAKEMSTVRQVPKRKLAP